MQEIIEQLIVIRRELSNGKERMDSFEKLIEENRQAHQANASALAINTALTQEIYDILLLGKSFFKVLKYVGIVAKWLAAVGAGIAAIYGFFHIGGK